MRLARPLVCGILVLALGGWEPFRSPADDVTAGNAACAAGRYDDAIRSYEAARSHGVDPGSLDYNIGTAKLKQAEGIADPAAKAALEDAGMKALADARRSNDP